MLHFGALALILQCEILWILSLCFCVGDEQDRGSSCVCGRCERFRCEVGLSVVLGCRSSRVSLQAFEFLIRAAMDFQS